MLQPGLVQCTADRPHHTVQHRRRRNDVCTGFGMHDRRPSQQLQRRVVEQIALRQRGVVAVHHGRIDNPAMAVIRIFAETHVGDDDKLRRGLLQRTDRLGHYPAGTEVVTSAPVLFRRNAEQEYCRNAKLQDRLGLPGQFVHRKLELPWHRRDWPALPLSVAHEQRIDEVGRRERCLTHHPPQRRADPHPPRAEYRFRNSRTTVDGGLHSL